MYFEEPEEIVYHFLRTRVAEVTRVGLSNRTSTDSESFVGDDSTVEFTISANISAVTSVTVDGTTQTPYLHYNIDIENNKIKFATAPGNTLAVIVNYIAGTNWIFPDMPRNDLSKASLPKIGSWQISEITAPEELGDQANSYDTCVFQIDVVTHKEQTCTINSESVMDVNVAKYLARKIKNAFKDYAKTDLIYVIYDFSFLDNANQPFQEEYNIFRRTLQIQINFRNLRRMIT